MSTQEGVQYTGRYHEYTEGYHDKCGESSLGKLLNLYGNPSVLNIPRCTHDMPHTHHGIPQCTHGIPHCTELPWCTHDTPRCTEHPSVYSMISSQCTEHPPLYSISPGVLHRHYAGSLSEFGSRTIHPECVNYVR